MKFISALFLFFGVNALNVMGLPLMGVGQDPRALNLAGRSGTKLTQAQAEAELSAAGITVTSSGGCTDRTNPTCTSLDGILSGTVDGVIALKEQSGANIVITGGTEVGHASGTQSHANGFKVDIKKGSDIDTFIKTTFPQIADRGDGFPQWRAPTGDLFCDEGNHWDITFQ